MSRRGLLPAVLGVAALAGAAVLVGLNPQAASAPPVVDPRELLVDPLLTISRGPWTPSAGARLEARRDDAARVEGTVVQEVPLTGMAGRAYRVVVRVRGAGVPGAVQVQTACGGAGEVARSPFTATAAWREVAATLVPLRPEGCSMRVAIEAGSGVLEVDRASLQVGALADPSFESVEADATGGLIGPWQAEGLTAVVRSGAGDALDGARAVQVTAGPDGGVLRQRLRLDASSESVLARGEVSARVVGGSASEVSLHVGRPCPTTRSGGDATAPAATASASVGRAWRALVAQQTRAPVGPDGLPPVPPALIRPDGVGCTVTVEVRVAAGATVVLDGADLRFTSLKPAWGDERDQQQLARSVTEVTTPIDQRMGGSVDGAASIGGS